MIWAVDATYVCVHVAERSCVTVCMCEKEKNHFMCFKFVLLFHFPFQGGNTAIKGTKSAGVFSSQGDPSSLKNVGCV